MKTRILVASETGPNGPSRASGSSDGSNDDTVREAAEALAHGQIVIFPTETVYGIGANAADPRAMAELDRLKSRAPDKPYTLHLGGPEEAQRYAGRLSPLTTRLIRKAWPGPLALVVPDRRGGNPPCAPLVEEGIYYEGTVGLRCPSHPVGRAILLAAGVPVAASSANAAGHPPPHEAGQALAEFDGKVPLIVDAGPTPYARPSTVVRIREDDSYKVLREGAITARRVARLARTRLLMVCSGNVCRSPMAVALAKRMLADRFGCEPEELADRGIEVASCGTGAVGGLPVTRHAAEALAERNLDADDHRSRPMTVDALLAADYIWVMTRGQRDAAAALAREAAGRVSLLDPSGEEIGDPMGGDVGGYRTCLAHLARAVAQRIEEVA